MQFNFDLPEEKHQNQTDSNIQCPDRLLLLWDQAEHFTRKERGRSERKTDQCTRWAWPFLAPTRTGRHLWFTTVSSTDRDRSLKTQDPSLADTCTLEAFPIQFGKKDARPRADGVHLGTRCWQWRIPLDAPSTLSLGHHHVKGASSHQVSDDASITTCLLIFACFRHVSWLIVYVDVTVPFTGLSFSLFSRFFIFY